MNTIVTETGKRGVFKDSNVIRYLNTLLIHLQEHFLLNKNTTFWKISEYSTHKYVYKTSPRFSVTRSVFIQILMEQNTKKFKDLNFCLMHTV